MRQLAHSVGIVTRNALGATGDGKTDRRAEKGAEFSVGSVWGYKTCIFWKFGCLENGDFM